MQQVYLVLFSLYWAQGLPVGFMTHALPVILRTQGVSLAHIGGFGLLMLPWSIKILWAPWVDRVGSEHWGHYKSWILITQLLSVLGLVVLAQIPIEALNQPLYLWCFFVTLLFINSSGATQDIATDGLAVKVLLGEQQRWGNTFQVIGSRLGFIVGGGALLWALDILQWQNTFYILAALVLLNSLPIWHFKEPVQPQKHVSEPKTTWLEQIKSYFQYFRSNTELKAWLWVLLSFKLADGLSGPLLKPLMVDLGLSLSQIGIYVTMFGAVAALIGAALAGFLLRYMQRAQALLIFSGLKIVSLAAYAWLAWQYQQQHMVEAMVIYVINALEDAVSAMLLVVMLTLVMQYSRKTFAGTDFTFQVAIMATVGGGLYTISGMLGDYLGYAHYLMIIVCMSVLLLWPIVLWARVRKR